MRLIYFLGIYDFTGVENVHFSKSNVTHSVMCLVTQAVCLCMTLLFGMPLIFCIHNKDVTAVLCEVYVNYRVCRSDFIN